MLGRSAPLLAKNSPFMPLMLALATLFLFSGCPTPPKPTPHVTTLGPVPQPIVAPVETVTLPGDTAPGALKDRPEAVLPEESLPFGNGKVPLSQWAALCGFTEIRSTPTANPPLIEMTSPGGTLTLFLGQRFAKWNGVHLGLGFPPISERGQVVAHSIDVTKTFYPLALGALAISKPTRVLVIDPGHGGADPGSSAGVRRAFEKDLTLDWALRVERLLTNSSWRVVLTRRDDRDVPRLERVAIADANQADLFISLHLNSVENSGGKAPEESGIETYCLTPVGAPSNTTRNFEDDLRHVYPNNEFDAQNLLLATRIQSSLIATTGRKDRGVRRARFMSVVREQKRPAILVEGGFLSNPTEANLLLRPDFREQMARAICNSLPN
jgi:N-acetylmuramoyl-L-alanine amidase